MSSPTNAPLKVLQVVGGMDFAGVETWLMHVLRNIGRVEMDFLVHEDRQYDYTDKLEALGARQVFCPYPVSRLSYARRLRQIIDAGGYDVVHAHLHHFNGLVLGVAARAGVPVRIAHSHLDSRPRETATGPASRVYRDLMEWATARFATHGLACSSDAADALFGPVWKASQAYTLLNYGIALDRFQQRVDAVEIRRSLGISEGVRVVGHVGRFAEQKNHSFLVEIIREAVELDPEVRFLLVGEGPLRPSIEEGVSKAGVAENVIFAGSRPDVPRLMLGAMDSFVFPSLFEGLGLVLVEAQAAGLPCVFSDVVPAEADVLPKLVFRTPLDAGARVWAQKVIEHTHPERAPSPQVARMVDGPFDVKRSAKTLEEVYVTTRLATSGVSEVQPW